MFIADMLSRAYLVDSTPKVEENFQLFQVQQEEQLYKDIEQLHQTHYLCMQQTTQTLIKQAIDKDQTMQALVRVIQTGWPDQREAVPVEL